MHLFKAIAIAGAIVAGSLASAQGSASASPLVAGAMASAQTGSGPVKTAYHRGGYYGGPRVYRPVRPVYRAYRPYPRVVCRTHLRTVRTAYGRLVTRPVQVCRRRF
jgi:hypothetical protein